MHKNTVALITLSLMLVSMRVGAWGALGHQVVCDIAWRHSSVAMRKQLSAAALRMGYKTFASGCLWADHVRQQKQHLWMYHLHYINVPRLATGVSLVRDCSVIAVLPAKPDCILTAIPYFLEQLKVADSQTQRDQALLLVAHFVADLHQPLHVSYADDSGGNKTLLPLSQYEQKRLLQARYPKLLRPMNLHYWWDTEVLACQGSQQWSKRGYVLYQANIDQGQGILLAKSDLGVWANESLAITREVYRDLSNQSLLHHCQQWQHIADTRLRQAGRRLAWVLGEL